MFPDPEGSVEKKGLAHLSIADENQRGFHPGRGGMFIARRPDNLRRGSEGRKSA